MTALFSHQQHNSNQDNNSEPGNANHFPFPAHHHVSASEGFDLVRVSTNLEKGITAVKRASEENLDMRLYLKLIITKFRMAIIMRYAPKLKDEMKGDLSEADLEFLQTLVKEDPERKPSASYRAGKEGHMFTSSILAILLEAYQNIDNAFITELPLELALVKILVKDIEKNV